MKNFVIAIVFGLALSACKGSSGTPAVNPNPVDGAQAVVSALPNAADATKAVLKGTLALNGLTLAPDSGGASVGTPSILAKIIDPGDDILSTNVNPGSSYELDATKTVRGKFQVTLKVNEDVNGDGVTPDTIVQSVPVSLVLGKSATLNLTLGVGVKPSGPGPNQQGSGDSALFPAAGDLLVVNLDQSDASGAKSDLFGALPSGDTVFDTNGDKFLETGADVAFTDADHDGWPDVSEAQLTDATATNIKSDGTVSAVDKAARTLSVRLASGAEVVYTVDAFASILPLAGDGTFLGGLELDTSLIGRHVQAYGVTSGGTNRASLIVVLPVGK